MSDLSPEDLSFASTLVRLGVMSESQLNVIFEELQEGLRYKLRPGEALATYLVRTDEISIDEMYQTAREMPHDLFASDNEELVTESANQKLKVYGLVLRNLVSDEIRQKAAEIVTRYRSITLEQALVVCRFPVVPVVTKLSREAAEKATEEFKAAGIPCQVVKWKSVTNSGRIRRHGAKRASTGRFRRNETESPKLTVEGSRIISARAHSGLRSRTTSGRVRRPNSRLPQDRTHNPFATPIPERSNYKSHMDSRSLGKSSIDFLVVGSSAESGVIFLDPQKEDNTETALTIFSDAGQEIKEPDGAVGIEISDALPKRASTSTRAFYKPKILGLGSVVSGYKLNRIIGKGGFAKVYHATHTQRENVAAVKIYRNRDSRLLRRITRREAKLISTLRHPRLVSIFNVGQEAGSFFVVMEYVQGQSLTQLVKKQGPIAVKHVIQVALDVSEALHFIHKNGLVHRDVKPSNIVLEADGRARLLDFELVKGYSLNEESGSITESGQLVGTPRFMSPEQIDDSKNVTPLTDIYALGVTLYYMLTGRYPFNGKTLIQIVKDILIHDPPPPSSFSPLIPTELDQLIMRLITKDKTQRPQTMLDVIQSLFKLAVKTDELPENLSELAQSQLDAYLPSQEAHDTKVIKNNTRDSVGDAAVYGSVIGLDSNHSRSTVVHESLQVGKIDNETRITTESVKESDEDGLWCRRWEALENDQERQQFLSSVPPAILASPVLSAAREWHSHSRCEQYLEQARYFIRQRETIPAVQLLEDLLDIRPEHSKARKLLEEIDEPIGVSLEVVRSLAKSGRKQLYPALLEIIDRACEPGQVRVFLEAHDLGHQRFEEVLTQRRSRAWIQYIIHELFDRSTLRHIINDYGIEVSRRMPKRRLVQKLLTAVGFHVERPKY